MHNVSLIETKSFEIAAHKYETLFIEAFLEYIHALSVHSYRLPVAS